MENSPVLHLCATARLAKALRSQPPAAAAAAWPTCRALTVGAWLEQVLDDALLEGRLPPRLRLDAYGEKLLWESIVAEGLETAAAPLFDLRGMAACAAEAHALQESWQLRPAPGSAAEEARLFAAWRREFHRRTAARGWLESTRAMTAAIELVEAGQVPLPEAVCFAGFDRATPQETRLREALAARGVRELPWNPPAVADAALRRREFPDLAAECRAVAAWAAAHLAARPEARLGIVAPDLAALRQPLAAGLDDALHPESLRPAAAEAPRRYNFSLGEPLAGEPLVRTALALLALATRPRHEQSVFSALLLDPAWSAGLAEADSRARIDAALRRELEYFTDLPALLRLMKRLFARDGIAAPRLKAHLEAFAAALGAGPRRRPPSAWGEAFRQWLELLGWPGDRPLSSREYQARQAFLETLAALGRGDDILGPVAVGEASRRLGQLCGERIFQPETVGRPAIEIVGVLESSGLAFDALWVMGMNDHAWPPPPRPNPLLPAELQRQAGAPRASAEVELAFAATVHRRLVTAAADVTFSHLRQDGSRLLRPSPLLAGIPAAPAEPPATPAPPTPALERLADAQAPAVAPGEKVSGGTGLLRAQAICPAWGFYRYRLGAEALGTAVEGLAPMERGTLVHGALERFWRETGSLAGLRALDEGARRRRIAAAVAGAQEEFETTARRLPPRFRTLEAGRLERLLDAWLALEATRPGDFTVVACEREATLEIEGIRVRTIIDRIDRLPDGRCLVIDYKTGRAIDTRNWAEARITEPQLPLYAAIAVPQEGGETVAGVAFAKVVLEGAAFAGVGESGDLLPGLVGLDNPKRRTFPADAFPDWPALLRHWHERLHAVAAEVGRGEAAVRFADATALRYCEVLPLLRLAERAAQWEAAGAGA